VSFVSDRPEGRPQTETFQQDKALSVVAAERNTDDWNWLSLLLTRWHKMKRFVSMVVILQYFLDNTMRRQSSMRIIRKVFTIRIWLLTHPDPNFMSGSLLLKSNSPHVFLGMIVCDLYCNFLLLIEARPLDETTDYIRVRARKRE